MGDKHSALPPNWEVRTSRSRNMPYYFNKETKESRWDPPTGADVKKTNPTAGKIRVSHLLVKHSGSRRPSSWKQDNITRTKEEALELIENYQQQIKTGITSLAELALTESDCSSAKHNGDLGWFGRGQMQPAFEQASYALKVGELSEPVFSDSGIHLIYRTG
ncbi:hypothetical protein BB559_007373 [Furculomyces boomerangus]|uniref:Peptidyl-prolyl cis-trans isomerase n=2 Tax=Harpellales TaxID=61421 RepID=A0A2T9XXM9_9FUNG|nr:hypothetical protein BB559_007373 [Furculomyces boomerangus]PWA02830.1 hypothetical protein BB558_001017 [Smittium angustum]